LGSRTADFCNNIGTVQGLQTSATISALNGRAGSHNICRAIALP
jgi:hypothetical protein